MEIEDVSTLFSMVNQLPAADGKAAGAEPMKKGKTKKKAAKEQARIIFPQPRIIIRHAEIV